MGAMKIVQHPTLDLLRPLFLSEARPKVRFARAQEPLFGATGLMPTLAALHATRGAHGQEVMHAAQRDGSYVLLPYQVFGLFNPTRKVSVTAWQFAQFDAIQIEAQVADLLQRLSAHFAPAALLDQLDVFLFPGDPANRNCLMHHYGMSMYGGTPGVIQLALWPDGGNLARLGPCLARALLHTLRWSALPQAQPTLADFLAVEGLAAAFIAESYPEHAAQPWLVAHLPPAGWDATLAHIAAQSGVASYEQIMTNVYGALVPMETLQVPTVAPLALDELAYSQALIMEALSLTEPRLIAAYLYGDAIVAEQGHPTVGLSPYAGFEVAYRLVMEYLARTGQRAVEAVGVASAAICAS